MSADAQFDGGTAPEAVLNAAPVGLLAAEALVRYATGRPDHEVERDYLEVKSTIAFDRPGFAKVAKFILAAANRLDPSSALQGHAVMVLGVDSHGMHGVEAVDAHVIDNGLRRFLGNDGPRWDLMWVGLDGKWVLVIVVQPKPRGTTPFLCMASGDGLRDGAIYIRVSSETREATGDEVRRMMAAIAATAGPDVSIELRTELFALPFGHSEQIKAGIVAAEKARRANDSVASLVFPEGSMATRPYLPRSVALNSWVTTLEEAWPAVRREWMQMTLPGVGFVVVNQSERFLKRVVVNIQLPESCVAVRSLDGEDFFEAMAALPGYKKPQNGYAFAWQNLIKQPQIHMGVRLDDEGGEASAISLNVGDLRPRGQVSFQGEDVIVYLTAPSAQPVLASWEMTAEGFDQVFCGEFEIDVDDEWAPDFLLEAFNTYLKS